MDSQLPPLNLPKKRKKVKVIRTYRIRKTQRDISSITPPTFPPTSQSARPKGKPLIPPAISDPPISPSEAISKYGQYFSIYEKNEILNFPEIYFLGRSPNKIVPDQKNKLNNGFDTPTHGFICTVGDHLAYRFEILKLLGSGAFGQAVLCFDHKKKKEVVAKIIINTPQMHEQGRTEAKILSRLNRVDTEYVVKAYDFFVFRNHVCITYEKLGHSIYSIIVLNKRKPLQLHAVRYFARQMLLGLDVIHRCGIVHCDIKPDNVLIRPDSPSRVKYIDFGSAFADGKRVYDYIQSRFYRAPEVILGHGYGSPVDIWSLGLVILEMLIGRPVFMGASEADMLALMTEALGDAPRRWVMKGTRSDRYYDEDGIIKDRRGKKPGTRRIIPQDLIDNEDLSDFIERLIKWNPESRITATDALEHPWISEAERPSY